MAKRKKLPFKREDAQAIFDSIERHCPSIAASAKRDLGAMLNEMFQEAAKRRNPFGDPFGF